EQGAVLDEIGGDGAGGQDHQRQQDDAQKVQREAIDEAGKAGAAQLEAVGIGDDQLELIGQVGGGGGRQRRKDHGRAEQHEPGSHLLALGDIALLVGVLDLLLGGVFGFTGLFGGF